MASSCDCGNELSGSINAVNFLTSSERVNFSRRTVIPGVNQLLTVCV